VTRFAQGRQEEPPLSALIETLRVPLSPPSLRLALTHRSFAYENGGLPTNERLEFLGDSILGQAITVKLFRDHPELAEGDLAKRRSSLVSSAALAEAARAIQLGQYIRLGRGESLTGGADKPSILADTLEAIIGATFIDCGPDIATALVLRLLAPLMEDDTSLRCGHGSEDEPAGDGRKNRGTPAGVHHHRERPGPQQKVRGNGNRG